MQEIDETYEWTTDPVLGTNGPRRFYALRGHGANPLSSNLTELTAAQSVDRGFMNHNDWLAHVLRYQYVGNHVKPPYNQRVLDVGCGQLQLPLYLYRNRYPAVREYWGIDLRAEPEWLRPSNWKTPLHLVRADFALDADVMERIAGWPGQFDMVVYLEAHEHVGEPEHQRQTMRNIARWTRPGGTLFFSTPNAGVSDSTAANHLRADGTSREWTLRDKLDLVDACGFGIQEVFGTFGGVRRLPEEAMRSKEMQAARRYLSTSMFTNFAFLAYPEYANNAIIKAIRLSDKE